MSGIWHTFHLRKVCGMADLSITDIRKLLRAASHFRSLKLGKAIHAHLLVSNQVSRNQVIARNFLINLYSKCGDLRNARLMFDKMSKKNIVSWATMMAGYLHHGNALEVIRLFKDMTLVDKLCPNKYVLATVLSSCSHMNLLDEGMQCHGYALKSGLIFHLYVKNALVHMYSYCCDMNLAIQVLNATPNSDLCTFNSLLKGLLHQGELTDAYPMLRKIVVDCNYEEWDTVTCVNILGICSSLKDLKFGGQVHSRVVKAGMDMDLFVGSAAVDMYGKCGEVSSSRKYFDGLHAKNEVTWTAILNALLQNEDFEEALKLFLEMESQNVAPNECTIAVILKACAGIPAIGFGNSMHAHAEKMGMKGYTIIGNALIHMMSRCGQVGDASYLFSSMLHRDVITWNMMLSCYAYHGFGKEALDMFQQMLAAQEHPTSTTFVAVLSACSVLGSVDEGFYYLNTMMREFGIAPGLEHYTCVVGLLCKAGRLDEAESFMRTIPIRWDVVAWRTLLSACHVHRNYGLGKRVADNVMLMDPKDAGTCILMSNIHAKANRWDKVAAVRKWMRGRSIRKEPGLSWAEIGNETHVFISNGKSHVDFVQISEKIKKLIAEIKLLGYRPDFLSELHDIEEEQKEDQLSFHSEKMAIAYALIKTPPGSPIRVMKNLRMCDDCHSAASFISKCTKRTIIVRDVNRFHSFRDGSCSCSDYW